MQNVQNINRKIKSYWGLKLTLFFLFFFFNFSLGIQRENIYVNYAYAYGALLTVLGLFLLAKKQSKIRINRNFVWLFFVIQILTFLFSIISGTTINGIVNAGHQIMFFIIFGSIFYIKKFNTHTFLIFICDLLILVTTISLLYAIYGYLFGSFSYGPFIYDSFVKSTFRMQGWYPSPNYLGPALAIGALILIYKLTNTFVFSLTKKNKIFLIILLIFHIIGIILTGSKGTYLAFIIGLLTFAVVQKKLFKISIKHIIYFVSVIFILYLSIDFFLEYLGFNRDIIENELLRTETIEQNLQGGDRIYFWKKTYDILKRADAKELFFGHGFGAYINITGHAAHSGFLEVITGNGIIVFILYILLYYKIFRVSLKFNNTGNIGTLLVSIMTFILVKNLTNNETPSNNFPGIVFIIILVLISFKPIQKANTAVK